MKMSMDEILDGGVSDGDHVVTVEQAIRKTAKTGAQMIELTLKTEGGGKIWDTAVTVKADGSINHPGWSRLKQLFKASKSGITEFDDENTDHLMLLSGLTCKATIKNEMDDYSGQMRTRVKKYSENVKSDDFAI
jgi:hypothetical protein